MVRGGGFETYAATICESSEYHAIAYRPLSAFLAAGRVPEGIRTVIVLIMDYFVESSERPDGYRLSNYARACWSTIGPKTNSLAQFLNDRGCRAEILDLPQREAACRAGLGFIGRNAMFYAYGLGSYVGIASIGTDAVLEKFETCPGKASASAMRDVQDVRFRVFGRGDRARRLPDRPDAVYLDAQPSPGRTRTHHAAGAREIGPVALRLRDLPECLPFEQTGRSQKRGGRAAADHVRRTHCSQLRLRVGRYP